MTLGPDQCLCYSVFINYSYICYMKNLICKLVSVAEQARYSPTWSHILNTGFLASRPIYVADFRDFDAFIFEPQHVNSNNVAF